MCSFTRKGNKPMLYQITVSGSVDQRYLPVLGDVKLVETLSESGSITTITGEMQDQSALGGIINTLIDNRYSLISVMKLNE
jgi:hypothetical protein